MQPHEYTIIGHSRSNIGKYLGIVAGSISAFVYLTAGLLIQHFGNTNLFESRSEIIFWPLSAGAIYVIVHLLFDKWLWKCKGFRKILDIPNIHGTWQCQGQTKNKDGNTTYSWESTVTITQSWEKINVRTKTSQSRLCLRLF